MKRTRSRSAVLPALVLVVAAGLGLPRFAWGLERSFPLNFERVSIEKLIERVGTETGRTILFDESVRGSVSIVIKRPVTESEAWSILDSSLSMLGFSLLPSTVDYWRVVKVADAVGEAPFVWQTDERHASFVTTLIPLEHSDLQAVMRVLEPLSGARVTLVPFEPTRSLIASGPEREIARLTTIADELDRVDEIELRMRVLRYRSVEAVEPLVEARIESAGISDRRLQVWSDERTNSILFRGIGDAPALLARFLDRIDRPIEGGGRIRILRVLNRDPEEIGELIRELGSSTSSAGAASQAGIRGTELAGADFAIVVDKPSRSLVVSADTATHMIIRDVLEFLDELPQLIAVDITVSELRTPRNFRLAYGFSVPVSTGSDVSDLSGLIVSTPRPGGLLAQPGRNSTVFGRLARESGVPFMIDAENGIEIPILESIVIDGGDFTAQTDVLIQPSLIVTAGEHHEIFVGDNIPVPISENSGGIDSDSGTSDILARTVQIDRTDVGIRVGIDARAGREGKIQIGLELDISSIVPSRAGDVDEVGPSFSNQALVVTARLDDGETAIVAAYRQKTTLRIRSGAPWLSDIPYLGRLFTADEDLDQDVRLVVAVRASRVSTPAELVAISIRRRLAFQRRAARGQELPSSDGPPFGVRVTTRLLESDAEAIAEGLTLRGHRTLLHQWSLAGEDYFDVYIISLESMAEAARIAGGLSQDGWAAELVVMPTQS